MPINLYFFFSVTLLATVLGYFLAPFFTASTLSVKDKIIAAVYSFFLSATIYIFGFVLLTIIKWF